jgi:hypothetical protein
MDEIDIKIINAYDRIVNPRVDEINKKKFDREIEKFKTNKNRLNNLKKTIAAMGTMLPKDDTEYLLNKIKGYLGENEVINEAFDTTATHIHNEIEKRLKKFFGKNADVIDAGVKAGKSQIIVTKDDRDYLIAISPK